MLARHVPRVCRMSWSSRTAAAASSPQLISGSITSSIRPTPTHSDQNTHFQSGLDTAVQYTLQKKCTRMHKDKYSHVPSNPVRHPTHEHRETRCQVQKKVPLLSHLPCWGRWVSGCATRRGGSCHCPAPAGSVWCGRFWTTFVSSWSHPGSCMSACHPLQWGVFAG